MKKHFTLTEILVTIAIIAVLAGMGIGIFTMVQQQSAYSGTEVAIGKISGALKAAKEKRGLPDYQGVLIVEDNTVFPFCGSKKGTSIFIDACGGMQELDSMTYQIGGVDVLCDAWGNPLIYICPGRKNTGSFDLISAGDDGMIDGTAVLASDGSFNAACLSKTPDAVNSDDVVN